MGELERGQNVLKWVEGSQAGPKVQKNNTNCIDGEEVG